MSAIRTIYLSELFIVLLMAIGIIPMEFSYMILILLSISFLKMNMLDSLKLFILSIPFFVAFPSNIFSDSMSVWRIFIIILAVKAGYEIFIKKQKENRMNFILNKLKNIKPRKNRYDKLLILFLLFILVNAVSLFFAQHIGSGIKKILFFSNVVLLFPIVTYCVNNEEDAISILKHILYMAVMVVFIGYLQFISTFFIPLYEFWQFWAHNVIRIFYGENLSELLSYSNTWFSYYDNVLPTLRMFSVFPDSHSFSLFVLILIPVIISLSFLYKEKRNFIFLLILFLLAIYFSGSRGVWLSSVFALISALFILNYEKEKENKIRKYILRLFKIPDKKINTFIIIYSVLAFFALIPVSNYILVKNQEAQLLKAGGGGEQYGKENALFKRALSITDLSETSNKNRIQIMTAALVSIAKHPIFGIGAGNVPLALDEKISDSKKGSSAHNIYLDIAVETGVAGLIVFILLIIEIMKTAYKFFHKLEKRYAKIFAGSFFVYFSWVMFYGLFDVVIFNDKVLMIVVILISILYSFEKIYLKNNF